MSNKRTDGLPNDAPYWMDAPEWANWLAQDCDGVWFWYENEPHQGPRWWHSIGGQNEEVYFPRDIPNWQENKFQRPTE